jgi:glucosylceramidase
MKNFNIERDKTILIPYIKAALKYRPDLKIWASPWSPPTWMKTNKHYANKPNTFNDLTEDKAVKTVDQFIQKKEYLSAYALYLSKFVQAYQNEGINVYAVHFQNEPYTYNQWPNCSWTAPAMRDFVSEYLGPKFIKDKVAAQIWFSTINMKISDFVDIIIQINIEPVNNNKYRRWIHFIFVIHFEIFLENTYFNENHFRNIDL